MNESSELWMYTSISILAACGIAQILRNVLNRSLANTSTGYANRKGIVQVSEIINACISTYMLVVGTYEKCILIGEGLVFEYYVTTVMLSVVYCYILTSVPPNPLPVVMTSWMTVTQDKNEHENGDVEANAPHTPMYISTDGVRRRGVETPVSTISSTSSMTPVTKRGGQLWASVCRSGPSLLGQFLGLHVAIQYLNLVWDGYLTSHHFSKTGLLRDCIIVLQTGPLQGFIIEAAITFLFEFAAKNVYIGRRSFFISSCILSLVTTSSLYAFINITGSFANPLLAYALERECLYDITTVANHVIVYWFGSLAGTVAYNFTSSDKHSRLLAATFSTFALIYFLTPDVL